MRERKLAAESADDVPQCREAGEEERVGQLVEREGIADIRRDEPSTTAASRGVSLRNVATSTGAAQGTMRSFLSTETKFLRAHATEQARWADDEHNNEDHEPHGVLQARVEIVAGEGFCNSDDKAAEIGAPDAAEARRGPRQRRRR
jgi:hypothetical protein